MTCSVVIPLKHQQDTGQKVHKYFKPKVLFEVTDVLDVPVLTLGLMKNEGLAV